MANSFANDYQRMIDEVVAKIAEDRMREEQERLTLAQNFLIIIFGVGVSIYISFIAALLWLWFAVPLGAPVIGAVHFYGLGLIYAIYTSGKIKVTKSSGYEFIFNKAVSSSFIFAAGYVAHFFV